MAEYCYFKINRSKKKKKIAKYRVFSWPLQTVSRVNMYCDITDFDDIDQHLYMQGILTPVKLFGIHRSHVSGYVADQPSSKLRLT